MFACAPLGACPGPGVTAQAQASSQVSTEALDLFSEHSRDLSRLGVSAPEDHINVSILHSAFKAQDKEDSKKP